MVLARIHSLVDDCTKARDNISESEVDVYCKKCLSRIQLQLKIRKKIRTYCICTPGVWMCSYCNVQHASIESSDD